MSNDPNLPAPIAPERLEAYDARRIGTVEPGAYWRSTSDVPMRGKAFSNVYEGLARGDEHRRYVIPAGTTLLLLAVEDVDDAAHTVVLHGHPSRAADRYRILLRDLVSLFEPDFDGEAVRDREVAAAHARVAELQASLVRDQDDPSLLLPLVDRKEKERRNRRERERERAGTVAPAATTGSAISTNVAPGRVGLTDVVAARAGQADVDALVVRAERDILVAESRAEWLKSRTDQIASALGEIAPFYQEKAAVALARTAGARSAAERILRGLLTLGLYTGKEVEVETIRSGPGALDGARMTLMQRRLFAAEELAAHAAVDADFDYRDRKAFALALANDALLDQIAPTPRCVVALALTRDDVGYDNPFHGLEANKVNRRTFLLVRNGSNVHFVTSTLESHRAAKRLFPSASEVDEIFTARDPAGDGKRALSIDDTEFSTAKGRMDDVKLHYKRLSILLAGLDHRLGLFGAFYPPTERMGFVALDFQEKYVDFVRDDEEGTLLGSGMESVRDWWGARNRAARSGSRVACLYADLLTHKTAPGVVKKRYERDRSREEHVAEPDGKHAILVARREGRDLVVDVPVKSLSYRSDRAYDARVQLDQDNRGWLCLDEVSSGDLLRYVRDRRSRLTHLGWIGAFKAAAAALAIEEEAEAPARAEVAKGLIEGGVVAERSEADARVADAVRAWRAANRGAPLPEVGSPKLREVRDQAWFLGEGDLVLDRVLKFLAARDGDAIGDDAGPGGVARVAMGGRNRAYAYFPVADAPRLGDWQWARRESLSLAGKSVASTSSSVVWIGPADDPGETALRDWPSLAGLRNAGRQPCSYSKLAEGLRRIRDDAARLREDLGTRKLTADEATVAWERVERVRRTSRGPTVGTAYSHYVVGVVAKAGQDGSLAYVVLNAVAAGHLLARCPGESLQRFEERYVKLYVHPERGRDIFRGFRDGVRRAWLTCELAPPKGMSPDPADGWAGNEGDYSASLKGCMERLTRKRGDDAMALAILSPEAAEGGWLQSEWARIRNEPKEEASETG